MDLFFQKYSYKVEDNLVDEDYLKLAVKYFDLKFNIIKDYTTRRPDLPYTDEVVYPFNRCYYNDPLALVLLLTTTPKIEKIVGKKLYPTYVFCRGYEAGQNLLPHTDRESCEYSVTLPLCGPSWPIHFKELDRSVACTPGQGLIYKGQELTHSRKRLKEGKIVQLHLHYVDKNGPHKDFKFDQKTEWLKYASSTPFFTMSSRSEHISFS